MRNGTARKKKKETIKVGLKRQFLSLGLTLVLLAISICLFHKLDAFDYVLIALGVLELVGILYTLLKRPKK